MSSVVDRDGVVHDHPTPEWIEELDLPKNDGPISKEDAIMMAQQRLAAEAKDFIDKTNEKILQHYVPGGTIASYKPTKITTAALKWAAERFREVGWQVSTYDNRMDLK